MFPIDVQPTREAALNRLQAFLPQAGRTYAAKRNYDFGPENRDNISLLSPYVRHRLVTEAEVIAAVLTQHTAPAAEKFIQEVCWRTYWKGWLEMRPSVWRQYQQALATDLSQVTGDQDLKAVYDRGVSGQTGIACFDAWATELQQTGYLHNHARMWFASIWIFTLKLPWTLGADFFLRYLLDGDPASNTLSWRWVGGLQTQGKTYLARAENIAKFTDGRFPVTPGLAPDAHPLAGAWPPKPRDIPLGDTFDPAKSTALIVHEDDIAVDGFLADIPHPLAVAGLTAGPALSPLGVSSAVLDFRRAALKASATKPDMLFTADQVSELADWVLQTGAMQVITPYAPVGPMADALEALTSQLVAKDVVVVQIMRDWDRAAWPFATKGFFKFKETIPDLIAPLYPLL